MVLTLYKVCCPLIIFRERGLRFLSIESDEGIQDTLTPITLPVEILPPRNFNQFSHLYCFCCQDSDYETPTLLCAQDSSDAVAAVGLTPESPTETTGVGNLAFFKPEDVQYFANILKEEDETELLVEERKECKIMRLLLKIENGT